MWLSKFLFWWQLPQVIGGFLTVLVLGAKKQERAGYTIYVFQRNSNLTRFLSGVSLAWFIILPPTSTNMVTIRHEYGHSIQSMILGPLYLIFIGIPSAIGNLVSRKRRIAYYSQPWEAWADRLGGNPKRR